VARDGVGEAHRLFVAGEIALPFLGHEAVVHDLLVAAGGERVAQVEAVARALVQVQHRRGGAWRSHRHVLVAVDACDLLDEVFLDGEVEAPAGRRGADRAAVGFGHA
jgi:hypothetical protein